MKKNFLNFFLFLFIFIWSNFYLFLYPFILQNMNVYDVNLVRYNIIFFGLGDLGNTVKFINVPSVIGLLGIILNLYIILKNRKFIKFRINDEKK